MYCRCFDVPARSFDSLSQTVRNGRLRPGAVSRALRASARMRVAVESACGVNTCRCGGGPLCGVDSGVLRCGAFIELWPFVAATSRAIKRRMAARSASISASFSRSPSRNPMLFTGRVYHYSRKQATNRCSSGHNTLLDCYVPMLLCCCEQALLHTVERGAVDELRVSQTLAVCALERLVETGTVAILALVVPKYLLVQVTV